MTACSDFAKGHLKDYESMKKKILWSDRTELLLFGQNSKHNVSRTPGITHHLAHAITMGVHSSDRETGHIEGRMDANTEKSLQKLEQVEHEVGRCHLSGLQD